MLQCVVVFCYVLQCVVVFYYVLQWVDNCMCFDSEDTGIVVCCSVLQCVAVCCSGLHCVAVRTLVSNNVRVNVLQRVAVCCSVLQCVAVCYIVLQ